MFNSPSCTDKSDIDPADKHLISETICQTVDNFPCQLPFSYKGKDHSYCSFVTREEDDIAPGALWCAIDNEVKSVGECKSNCDKRTYTDLGIFHI